MSESLARIENPFLVFVETSDGTRRYVSICDTDDRDLLATVLHKPDALRFDLFGARSVLGRLVSEWVEHKKSRRFVRTMGIEVATEQTFCRCPGCIRRRQTAQMEKRKAPSLEPSASVRSLLLPRYTRSMVRARRRR